ncbi:MAG: hypothetical protein H0W75_00645 [Chitinophagaceae bacterium]|nr:hypothetical protein [Chitinophagaceae bacterium]
MQSITIPLNGKTIEEVQKADGVIISINWDALIPAIESFVRLRPDEVIDYLSVSEVDVQVHISRKRGRKKAVKIALPASGRDIDMIDEDDDFPSTV